MKNCHLCGKPGTKALIGPFPVKVCLKHRYDGAVVWGFWSRLALMTAPHMPGPLGGFGLLVYEGGYLPALAVLLRGDPV